MKRFLLSAASAVAMMTHVYAAQAPRPGSLDSRVTSVVYQSNRAGVPVSHVIVSS